MSKETELVTPYNAEADPELIRNTIGMLMDMTPVVHKSSLQPLLQISPRYWKPVLEEMINDGDIVVDYVQKLTPKGRYWTYTLLKKNVDYDLYEPADQPPLLEPAN